MTGHITHLISEYIDGALPPKVLEKAKAHLFFCNHCRNMLKEMQENSQRLKNLAPVKPPTDLEEKIIRSLEKEMQTGEIKKNSPESLKEWFFSYRGLAITATAALAIVLFNIIPINLKSKFQPQERKPSLSSKAKTPVEKSATVSDRAELKESLSRMRHSKELSRRESTLKTDNLAMKKVTVPAPMAKEAAPLSAMQVTRAAVKGERRGVAQNEPPSKMNHPQSALGYTPQSSEPWVEIKGQSSGVTEPFQEVITDLHSWRRIWHRHVGAQEPKPGLPPVDFGVNEVLFICAGSQPTGGYSLDITKVENTEWEGKPARVVYYQIKTPPENSMKMMVITQPFVFRLVPKIQGTTFFKPLK